MTGSWRNGILTAAAAVALVLVVADFVLAQFNRSMRVDINARQQLINENIELGRVNEALVRAVATAAIRNHDPELQEILAAQGITVNPATAAAGSPVPSSSAAATTPRKGTDQ